MKDISASISRSLAEVKRASAEAVAKALPEALKEVKDKAQEQSSGPVQLHELRRRGHPYAKRHGAPLLDPGVVNIQSGLFWRSWKTKQTKNNQSVAEGEVVNTAPYAEYLEAGTSKMFRRPVAERSVAASAKSVRTAVVKALARALAR